MDAYELECIFRQLKIQHQQQSATHEHMLIAYKHSVEFCVKVNNIDWNMQLHSKLELLQLKCQNEMRELSKEYEMEKERRRTLEQRPIGKFDYILCYFTFALFNFILIFYVF